MSDELLSEQMAYYRRRAAEYDATAYGDLDLARARIARLVPQLRPSGDVLEIACGTGLWTDALAGQASTVTVTAIDAAPEAIRIAQQRITATNVTFVVADIFSWDSHARFDTIFFSAWLSHVPATRFETFWRSLRGLLADGGRVLFVDEHVDVRDKEAFLPGHQDIVTRTLRDGSQFRIVKEFVDPHQLTDRLTELGWHSRIDRDGDDWIIGEARPVES